MIEADYHARQASAFRELGTVAGAKAAQFHLEMLEHRLKALRFERLPMSGPGIVTGHKSVALDRCALQGWAVWIQADGSATAFWLGFGGRRRSVKLPRGANP